MSRATARLTAGAVTALVLSAITLCFAPVAAQAQSVVESLPVMTAARAQAFARAASAHLNYVPGEVLVKFKAGVRTEQQQSVLRVLRSRPAPSQLEWIGDVALLRDATDSDAPFLAALLRAQPEVEYAEPNYLRHLDSAPSDPSFAKQWNLSALDLPRAWDINAGSNASTIVAVLDTGVTTVNQVFSTFTSDGQTIQQITVPFAINPDLSVSRLVAPRDFATPAVFGSTPAAVVDMVGHGTHVTSTMGEDTNNDIAEAGIAFNARIMPVKVCVGFWDIQFALATAGIADPIPPDVGGCPISAIVQGLRYAADNGAKVVNMSLGGPDRSTAERDALIYAIGKGAFVAIAAGNEFEDGNPVDYPAADAADLAGAMSVAAVGRSLKRAFYSNTGSYIEVAAPGGDPRDGGSNGVIWQASLLPPAFDPTLVRIPRFDRYAEVGAAGTSSASPHVAGIAALLVAQGVTKPAAVEALIKATALDLGAAGRDDEYGHGLIQPRGALRGLGLK